MKIKAKLMMLALTAGSMALSGFLGGCGGGGGWAQFLGDLTADTFFFRQID